MDGLYAPIGLRVPRVPAPHPLVLLSSATVVVDGHGSATWWTTVADSWNASSRPVRHAWIDYRTEVDLGYHRGGALTRDWRAGGELLNRAPLERAGKTTAWITYDHPLHGYVAPVRGDGDEYEVDTMQRRAITEMLDWLAAHMR
jgi:hypothetical protein